VPQPGFRFTLDPLHGFVEASFTNYILRTEADVIAWRAEVERELGRFGRKVDLLINLDGLAVKPSASRAFGVNRAAVLTQFTNISVRYGGDLATQTTVFTTAVRDGADANVYPTREAAVAALLEARRRERAS
jgi:hypothetical protein